MNAAAIQHLCAADPILGALIAKVGPCDLKPDRTRSPFQALVQAVAHQQLNGKAANTILTRFKALFPKRRFPLPAQVDAIETDKITGVGFSRAKASYVKGVARAALDGLVPGRHEIEQMTDDEIVARLTQIKGIGRWSVEMFLMFGLGRPDVLPVHDYGIQQGFAIVYGKRKPPKPDQILKHGERWRPYRTTAAWYLWRAVDLRAGKPTT
jgi:DNA-3-methyladenine glycosylase II